MDHGCLNCRGNSSADGSGAPLSSSVNARSGGGEDAEKPEGRTDTRRWSCQPSESKCLPWNPSSKKELER